MKPESISATEAKNEFGRVLDRVTHGHMVVITKHDTPRAVMMSVEDYEALTERTGRVLDTLAGEFDGLAARMQTPRARAAMKSAFDASPVKLGKMAIEAAKKRG